MRSRHACLLCKAADTDAPVGMNTTDADRFTALTRNE